jgi:hypothetical protein
MYRFMILGALVGCSSPPVKGTVVDGIGGAPLADFRLLARASGEVSPTCAVVEATSSVDGSFQVDGLCLSSSSYELRPVEEDWWLPEGATIAQGGGDALTLTAWHAPSGSGVYHLAAGALKYLKTAGDLKKDTVFETEKTFFYPSEIPSSVPLVTSADHLVLVGDLAKGTLFHPLQVAPEAIEVQSSRGGAATLRNVSTIGLRFSGPTESEESAAMIPDASKSITKKSVDRAATYIAGDALPPGRYAVFQEGARRLYLIDFGVQKAPATGDAAGE